MIIPAGARRDSASLDIWDWRPFWLAAPAARRSIVVQPLSGADIPAQTWDVDWFLQQALASGYPNLDDLHQTLHSGLRMRAHPPRHTILMDNYRSGDQQLLFLQEVADKERAAGVLDPDGPYEGCPFSPMMNLRRGSATRASDGKVRGTVDGAGDRNVIDLFEDSWAGPQVMVTTSQDTEPPPSAETEPQRLLRRAMAARSVRQAVLAAVITEPALTTAATKHAWQELPSGRVPTPSADWHGRQSFTDWVDGLPTGPNSWTDIDNEIDFAPYRLPSSFEFGHDVAIVREFVARFGAAFGIGKADWEAWYRQLCRRPLDLWLSCWMVSAAGIDVDLHAFFGGTGCCNEGNGVQNLVVWVIHHLMAEIAVTHGWRESQLIQAWEAERMRANLAAGIVIDHDWLVEFDRYRGLIAQMDFRADFDASAPLYLAVAESQGRLRAQEQVLGYRGWQPMRNLLPYSLKAFFDDSFWVALRGDVRSALHDVFAALFQQIIDLRERGVLSQDKKLAARVYGSVEPVVVSVGGTPLTFPADDSAIDILGADLDARLDAGASQGWLLNSPTRVARVGAELRLLRSQAGAPGNRRRLVDFKLLHSHISFLFYVGTYAPSVWPLLCRPGRALRVTGGLRRQIYGKAPLPVAAEADLVAAYDQLRAGNRVALQPRHGSLGSPLRDFAIVHSDAAGAPQEGAHVFYTLNPEGLRGGGSWMTAPGRPTLAAMSRFAPEMLHGFSSGVSEFCVANAHLDLFLSQTDAETVLEVLDNEGTASAIVGLVGRTPRMAECAIWRQEIMVRHGRRVVTIHRHRDKNSLADDLSKGQYDAFEVGLDRLGLPRPTAPPCTASAASMARIRAVLALPASDDD